MAFRVGGFFILVALLSLGGGAEGSKNSTELKRSSFPVGFFFGAASSAYQYEGAAKDGGRGPSIWDTFIRQHPEKIADHSNADVAIDFYHRYKEDVKMMKKMGLNAFRLSISWTRILPRGNLKGGINKEGIRFYNNLINELISKGLQPFVTIFHWDSPQALEDEYGGFLSSKIVDDYRNFANICFKEFGYRVKHWITLNEPWSFSVFGYGLGAFAPGRCSSWVGNCSIGNSGTEPYIVAHNLLIAHAAAVKLYKEEYQAYQKGVIGVSLVTHWIIPYSASRSNDDAAQRALDFMFGWFMDPISRGEYPVSMRSLLGNRLPRFSKEQSHMLKGSFDFIGINYYTAFYAVDVPPSNNLNKSVTTDSLANLTAIRNGILIGAEEATSSLHVYPKGIRDLLVYTKKRYNNPVIYITENGMDEFNNKTLSLKEALNDTMRIDFYRQHLAWLHKAIREGVDVRGYFPWSVLDNFEWNSGYSVRFGLNFVDFQNDLKRYPKRSAIWYRKFLHG